MPRDALLRLHQSLQARRAALREALADELENLRTFRTDQTGNSADDAFDADSEEVSAQLAELSARELNQIEQALTRLAQGKYGICEVCQRKIPVARLHALPDSATCITCQREMESAPGWEGRGGSGDWQKSYDAAPAIEQQSDIDLADIERNLFSDR